MGKTSKRQDAVHAREYRLRREQEEREKQARQDRIIRNTLLIVLAVALVIAGVFGSIRLAETIRYNKNKIAVDPSLLVETDKESYYVKMTVSYVDEATGSQQGEILLHLRPDAAPDTVKNFQSLVAKGFYNGLTFHRVIKDFMIQGGCPKGNGNGDAGYEIKGEFSANGKKNDLLHTRGVISMAREDDFDTASSQFFIVHQTSSHLDGQYAAFGEVISGMETVDAIASVAVDANNNYLPLHNVTILSVVFMAPQ